MNIKPRNPTYTVAIRSDEVVATLVDHNDDHDHIKLGNDVLELADQRSAEVVAMVYRDLRSHGVGETLAQRWVTSAVCTQLLKDIVRSRVTSACQSRLSERGTALAVGVAVSAFHVTCKLLWRRTLINQGIERYEAYLLVDALDDCRLAC